MNERGKRRRAITTSPSPIRVTEVLSWFEAAASKRFPRIPNAKDVWALTQVMSAISASTDPHSITIWGTPLDKLTVLHELSKKDGEKLVAFQRALKSAYRELPDLISAINEIGLDPLIVHRLRGLQSAVEKVFRDTAYLRHDLRPRGRQDRDWHAYAYILRRPIEIAWRKAGRKQLSAKPNGPLVKVLASALKALLGRTIPPATISTELKRTKQGG